MSRKAFIGDEKLCGKCTRMLPIDRFSINRTKTNQFGRKSVCKECTGSQAKQLRDARKLAGICIHCDSPSMPESDKCAFHITHRHKWRATITARINAILLGAKRRASDSGKLCTIDENWIRSKLEGHCELTGLPFDFEHGGKVGRFNPYAPSVDRAISGGDYTPDNCRMVIMALNVGMNFWGEETYRKVAKAYLRYRHKKVESPATYNLLVENPHSVRMRKH